MSHRDPQVYLAPDEPRCAPQAHPSCGRFSCARWWATVPKGGTVANYNVSRSAYSAPCSKWITHELKWPTQAPATRPVFKSLDSQDGPA